MRATKSKCKKSELRKQSCTYYTQGHSKVGNLTKSPESVLDKLQYHQIKRGDINGKGKKKEAVEKFELKMIRG